MLLPIITFFVVLSLLVLIHELGHYLSAKSSGIWVEEFGFGIPPRIWGKKIGETIYSINAFPFGGFVKLHGENPSDENPTNPKRAFNNKSKLTRTKIIVAGVFMNLVLGVISFAIVYSILGIPRETENVKIIDIVTGSPAQVAKLVVGDTVRAVDNDVVKTTKEFIRAIDTKKGQRVVLTVERPAEEGSSQIKVTITPRADPPEGEGPLGVAVSTTEIYYPPYIERPFYGVYYGFKEAYFWGKNTLDGFAKIVTDLGRGTVPKEVSGPVGIFAVTTQVAQMGVLSIINFLGILSINLAVLNIIPFPALDGGRLLFIGIESVFGRKVIPKVESFIHALGMIILLALLLAITVNDVKRVILAGGFSGFLNEVLK